MHVSKLGVVELVDWHIVGGHRIALDGSVSAFTILRSRILEVVEVDSSEGDLTTPCLISQLVDGQTTFSVWMCRCTPTFVDRGEHEAVFIGAVRALSLWCIQIVILSIDLNIFHIDAISLSLT